MLDDPKALSSIDRSGMLDFATRFPEQIEESYEATRKMSFDFFKPESIVVSGMGASAIGGHILTSLLFRKIRMPVFMNNAYNLPVHVNNKTLLFAVSYTGDTEETLSTFNEALERGCRVIGITSGGKLAGLCRENNVDLIEIPKEKPQRAAVAYLFTPILVVLQRVGVYDPELDITESLDVLRKLRDEIRPETPTEKNPAKQIAVRIQEKIPIIYGHTVYSAIAKRWHTQINENAKALSWSGEVPEMVHNEIAGWGTDDMAGEFSVIMLRDRDELPHIKERVEYAKKGLERVEVTEVWARGSQYLSKMLSTMYMGDMVSLYLAILRGRDPGPSRTVSAKS